MLATLEAGVYLLISGNGAAMFATVAGGAMTLFDERPQAPLRGTLRVAEYNFTPVLDDGTAHELDGDLLIYRSPEGVKHPVLLGLERAS